MLILYRITIILFIFILSAAPVVNGREQAKQFGLGPFFLQPVNANEAMVTVPEFIPPFHHSKGLIKINVTGRWTNVWAYNIKSERYEQNPDYADEIIFEDSKYETFFFDYEVFTLIPRASLKITENVNFEIKLPLYFYSGGSMDEFIEEFHSAFGIGQNKRTVWQRDKMSMIIVQPDGSLAYKDENINSSYYGDVVAGASIRVKDTNPAIGIRALYRIPTSNQDEIFEQPGSDVSMQASLSWRVGNFIGHHGTGVTVVNKKQCQMNYYDKRFSFMNTIEYSFSKKFSVVCHSLFASPLAKYSEFNKPVVEVVIGFKKKTKQGMFEFGIMENLIYYDNSPDIGVHFGYTIAMF